jgi:APA family basic amino acid/polyamine antiporter
MKAWWARTKPLEMLLSEARGEGQEHRLQRSLGPLALTSLGVGSIIGTGIFVLIGEVVKVHTGPAVMVSFIVAALACVFAGLCYAEFASMAPVAGSAYTYAYATLGELMAWIIGWDLILEYAVAGSAVAVGWAGYFNELLSLLTGLRLPRVITTPPVAYNPTTGKYLSTGGWLNLPAVLVIFGLAYVLIRGIRESASLNTVMVLIKVSALLLVIVVGAWYIDPANWANFAPFGWSGFSFFGHTIFGQSDAQGKPLGMLAGAAIIFFSYIGFDSVSTQAEEARNPQRDLPIGIIGSLIVCTILYIAVAAVLTGMIPYDKINKDAPVSDAFKQVKLYWVEGLVAVGALTGITSVVLVSMLGQTRVFMAMARDGLLPKRFFGEIHPRYRTPWKATIVTGIFVALLAGMLPLDILAELVSIGTLFAFTVVCAAVLIMRKTNPNATRPFRAPWVPFVPIMGMAICLMLMFSLAVENWIRLFVWLFIGLCIYFGYGRKHSVLQKISQDATKPAV